MKTFLEITRQIYDERLDNRFTQRNYYLNNEELDVVIYDKMIQKSLKNKEDFTVVKEVRMEHSMGGKWHVLRNEFHRSFYEKGVEKKFSSF
ncbi:hypothetical protein IFO69_05655 [Echinicola sp. CAU 1574]|uniref:Uncharacterized protein n=1 Tax=Echinicola arenosa TaxID=2774144 RepID=A0ABR9AKV9_9BACT|nr:hypothetical protein [Echinicola arenosa]MBD8488224.1 hypothetical protein [Echinicola arenosa]